MTIVNGVPALHWRYIVAFDNNIVEFWELIRNWVGNRFKISNG